MIEREKNMPRALKTVVATQQTTHLHRVVVLQAFILNLSSCYTSAIDLKKMIASDIFPFINLFLF